MLMETWLKISYMTQLIAACLIFMVPAKRKENFVLRMGIVSLILLVFSYLINGLGIDSTYGTQAFIYWLCYILLSVVFTRIGLDGSWEQAVYCAACACAMQHVAYDLCLIYQISGDGDELVQLLIYILVYIIFYYFFARKLPQDGKFAANEKALFPIATIVLLVWILSIAEVSGVIGFQAQDWHRIIYRLIDALCCFYVLWVQVNQKERMRLQRELDGVQAAWRQQSRQFHMTRETIDSINRKCHDLKHQIQALKYMAGEEKEGFLAELEEAVMIYDTAVQTGNQALDIVLMEKGMYCRNHGIGWTCMADGSRLDFMKLEDIYAIFGNALENAITAVECLTDDQKRIITAKVVTQKDMLMIQVQNYYEGELQFKDDLPVTTKADKENHGYGMKSIRYTAEKYNGTMTVRAEDGVFMLQVMIPLREPE